ncbi:LacI family DNA-binding transcriptional regulator [Brooklawnia cerclae]|uniref:LacI family transcriptional regulator n=1 Tax=Brooklawnia cerclae TaxID=349934 RepID=A0ABX0SG27_9ACTN|nr:LacI family transcriptional regulator [Brooklawnia cerclae]
MSDKPATIYDVAAAAGVSPSTVSRAFSRPGRVSSRTAARIQQVATELGYRAPRVVREEVGRQSKMLGIGLTDITNPYFFSIIRGAEHVAVAEGYQMMLSDSEETDDYERQLLERTMPLLDGMIIAASRLSDAALRAAAKSTPTVVLNRLVPGLPCVITDMARGMRRALEHLAEFGHRQVAYVSGPTASWSDGARWRAFREGCYELDLVEHRIGPTPPTVRGGMGILPHIRDRRVTAVVCYNDLISIGIMRAAKAQGLSIPGDLSVVGFDNIFASDLVTPGLTTVASPLSLLGERGARTVIALVNRQPPETTPEKPSILPMRLIIRESTGPAPKA